MIQLATARERLKLFLEKTSLVAKKTLGQNFLVSDRVITKIIEAAAATPCDQLIEVGPGPGALTDYLVQIQPNYTAIEMDSLAVKHWQSLNLNIIEGDALRLDWNKIYQGENILFVSNLPYQISSSIVIERSIEESKLQNMILMFQKEVAQRIRAQHQTEAYGMLSVVAQAFWKIETVCEAGPGDFNPAPKIASRVLKFHKLPTDLPRLPFFKYLKMAFIQRRKVLRTNLKSWLTQNNITTEQLLKWFADHGYTESVRAEEISVIDHQKLFRDLKMNDLKKVEA